MPKGSAVLSGHFCKNPVSLPSCFYWADFHLSVLYPGSGLGSCAKPECADRAGPLFFTTPISQPVWCAYILHCKCTKARATLLFHFCGDNFICLPGYCYTGYSKINNACYYTGIKEKALLFHQQSSSLHLKWIRNAFSRVGTLFLELQSQNL